MATMRYHGMQRLLTMPEECMTILHVGYVK